MSTASTASRRAARGGSSSSSSTRWRSVACALCAISVLTQMQRSFFMEAQVLQSILNKNYTSSIILSSSETTTTTTVSVFDTLFPVRCLDDDSGEKSSRCGQTNETDDNNSTNSTTTSHNSNNTSSVFFYVANTTTTTTTNNNNNTIMSSNNNGVGGSMNETTKKKKPILAICTATRSERHWTGASTTPLQHLIKSIAQSVTLEEIDQWDIRLLVAIDDDDAFWLNLPVVNTTNTTDDHTIVGKNAGAAEQEADMDTTDQIPTDFAFDNHNMDAVAAEKKNTSNPHEDSIVDVEQDSEQDIERFDEESDDERYGWSGEDENDDIMMFNHVQVRNQLPHLQVPAWLTLVIGVYPRIPNHIPFNEIALTAYQQGAEYFCRVNDDSDFNTTSWITRAVHVLQHEFDPPNVGVVGPSCLEGNTGILTHDMVHKTHMEIFQQEYYPPQFHNWYLDDWMTMQYREDVIGVDRSHKLNPDVWRVLHWVTSPRYSPDMEDQAMLPAALAKGRDQILLYLQKHYPNHNTTFVVAAAKEKAEAEAAAAAEAIKKNATAAIETAEGAGETMFSRMVSWAGLEAPSPRSVVRRVSDFLAGWE